MRGRAFGAGMAAVMIGLLAVYVLLHSPLRRFVDEALFGACTFFCVIPPVLDELADMAAALALIAAAGVGAWALVGRLVPGRLERLVVWALLAYAFIVMPSAIVAALGDISGVALLRPPLGPLLAAVPASVAAAWSWRRGWRPLLPRPLLAPLTPFLALLVLLVGGSMALRMGVSIQHPLTGFDALGYHAPLAVFFWQDGSISAFIDRFAETFALSHPGGIELWQGLLLIIGGEPLGVMGQLPFALLGAAGVALFATRLGLRHRGAAAGGLLFLLVPMVLEQSAALRNDLGGAALVVAVAAIVAAPASAWTPGRWAITGLGLGLMAATKLALLPAIGALGLLSLVFLVSQWRSGRDMGEVWRGVGVGVVLALLAVAPWWIRNTLLEGNPIYPADIPLIGLGAVPAPPSELNFVPHGSVWPLYPLFEPHGDNSGVGAVLVVAFLPAAFGLWRTARRRPLAVLLLTAAMGIAAWWLLDRREPRFLLGIVALAYAAVPFAFIAVRRSWRDLVAAIIGTAALFSVAVTIATALSAPATRSTERTQFYDDQWHIEPAAIVLPVEEALLLDDDCRPGFLNRLYPFLGVGGGRHVGRIACPGRTTETIEAALRRLDARHVYVVADPEEVEAITAPYRSDRFELLARSSARTGLGRDVERLLYRWTASPRGP